MLVPKGKEDAFALVISGGKPKMKGAERDEETKKSPEPEDEGDDLDVASEEVLAAMKAGDAAALKDALASFVKMCGDYDPGDDDEDDEGE